MPINIQKCILGTQIRMHNTIIIMKLDKIIVMNILYIRQVDENNILIWISIILLLYYI